MKEVFIPAQTPHAPDCCHNWERTVRSDGEERMIVCGDCDDEATEMDRSEP